MRHHISWADLAGAAVAVWGIGTEGRASIQRLLELGVTPVLVDDHPDATSGGDVLDTAAGGLDAMLQCEVVIKAPGISRLRTEVDALEAAGVAVVGGLGLWLESVDRSRVVCVTGTKGKSTTSSIIAHLGAGLGLRTFAGGNLGSPPFAVDAPTDVDLWVIETSSYQACDVASSPPVVAVTSLDPDHVPWHGTVDAYYEDKLSLCSQPGARVTVASAASTRLRAHAALLGPSVRWVEAGDDDWATGLGLLGPHNRSNVAVARATLEELGVVGATDHDALRRATEHFTPLPNRLERVRTINGVDYIDDGLSTNALAAVAALDAFAGRRVALLAGGHDRGIDYGPLADRLAERAAASLLVTMYESGPRLTDAARAVGVDVAAADDLAHAVRLARDWAEPDGVVLLSPAAASFDAFDDYRHRSRVFVEAIDAL